MRQLARSVVAEHPLLRREELTKSGHYYSAWEVTVAKKRVGYYTTEAEAASAFFRLTFERQGSDMSEFFRERRQLHTSCDMTCQPVLPLRSTVLGDSSRNQPGPSPIDYLVAACRKMQG